MTAPSGGQAQRVAIGRALAARPAILLLDEPFSALDQELRSSMHELLAQLRKRLAPTILMVSHDRDEAAAVADHIAVLSRCGLLQDDRVDLLYSRPGPWKSTGSWAAQTKSQEPYGAESTTRPWATLTCPRTPTGPTAPA
ncbi:ABC-type sulfate/molybdate transport systems ATPase subunit [Arthrobacter sp. UYEF6]